MVVQCEATLRARQRGIGGRVGQILASGTTSYLAFFSDGSCRIDFSVAPLVAT